jgi:hypothetical protein
MIAYKYLPPTRTSVLAERLIRFTQPAALNDPFETTPNLQPLVLSFREYLIRRIEETKYQSAFQFARDRSRVGSLIKKHLDEFLTTNRNRYAILSLSKTLRPQTFAVLADVKYSSHRPVMPAPEKWDGSQEQILRVVGSENLAELLFYTKSKDWEYEQELRMIANPKVANRHAKSLDGQDVLLYEFPPECLKEVIFGIRMPLKERLHIMEILASGYHDVQLFEAVLSDEGFDLSIVPFK